MEETTMKTSTLCVRVDPDIKNDSEKVLDNLGMSISTAINSFLKQIIIHQGLPFEVKMRIGGLDNIELMTEQEMINEFTSGTKEYYEGKAKALKDFDEEFRKKHNL